MPTFDKLKLVASLSSVEVVDQSLFTIVKEHGRVKSMRMSFTEPFFLSMELNYDRQEFVLEFTGKVLGPDYPQLISEKTIMQCFERINEMGFCIVDPTKMMEAEVVKCDVTTDISVDNIPEMTKWIRANVSSFQSYTCRILSNKNLIIEKNVCTPKRKKRMTIYNKENEMSHSKEREFVTENELTGAFDGKCRFELNLCSKQQIREALGLTGNTLAEVLHSDKNPIADFLNEVIAERSTSVCEETNNWKKYWQLLILNDCDYDLAKVEAKIRQYKDPRSTNIPKMMAPFRELLSDMPTKKSSWSKERLLSALR